jgi:WD40 repeat protein
MEHVIDLDVREWAHSLTISHDGNFIAVSLLKSNEIGSYSVKGKKWLWKVKWMEKSVVGTSIQFTSDDQEVVVLGSMNRVNYDATTGNTIKKREDASRFSGGHSLYSVPLTAISPNGKYAAVWQGRLEHDEWSHKAVFQNKWAGVWDLERNKIISDMGKIVTRYKNCGGTFDPGENYLLLGSMDGHIRVWSIAEQRMVREWQAYWSERKTPFDSDAAPYPVNSMTFSSDGRLLATMGSDRIPSTANIKIWDFSSNKLLHEFDDVTRRMGLCDVYPMAFGSDGKTFALEKKGQLCVYETDTWKEKWCVASWPEGQRDKEERK